MERDAAQSMLDEKFPKGANVAVLGEPSLVFNTARLMVINDELIDCGPYDTDKTVSFRPSAFETGDEGEVVLKGAHNGNDVVLRPAPDIPELVQQRTYRYTDKLLDQLRA